MTRMEPNSLQISEQMARAIERGLAEIDRGEGQPHEKIAEWLSRWGRDDEGNPPK